MSVPGPPALQVGTAGWSYPDWRGRVYPPRPPPRFDALRYLAAYLDVIEINSSFYRVPSVATAAKWLETVRDLESFRFTAKLHRGLTHAPPRDWEAGAAAAFRAAFAPLVEAGRLEAVLMQFPFFFDARPENLEHLDRLAEALAGLPLVVEVRHRSFVAPDVLARLAARGLSFCNVDQPLAATSIEPGARVTGPLGYLRLHGRNAAAWFSKHAGRDEKYDYLYSPGEIRGFVPLVSELQARTERVVVITNNHFAGKGPANALELMALLRGRRVEVPPSLLETYPRLRAIAVGEDSP